MSYTAPAKNHVSAFCSKCGHHYGHAKGTPGTTCPPCKDVEPGREKSKD